jgi:hypothetical protein
MQLKIRTNLQSHPAKGTAKVRLAPFLSSKDRSEIIQNIQVLTLRGLVILQEQFCNALIMVLIYEKPLMLSEACKQKRVGAKTYIKYSSKF